MTEDDARRWVGARHGEAVLSRLDRYAALLLDESDRQNLISTASREMLWSRHIVDCLQLVTMVGLNEGRWVDVGAGAGLPGVVVATTGMFDVTLVEPRRLRTAFLERVHAELDIDFEIVTGRIERFDGTADVISARAVASLPDLLGMTEHIATRGTVYCLPKGQSAHAAVADARKAWHGVFHVEQSVVDPASGIVIANGVRRR